MNVSILITCSFIFIIVAYSVTKGSTFLTVYYISHTFPFPISAQTAVIRLIQNKEEPVDIDREAIDRRVLLEEKRFKRGAGIHAKSELTWESFARHLAGRGGRIKTVFMKFIATTSTLVGDEDSSKVAG